MSDQSQGPGWWKASDDKWYPPETHPEFASGGWTAEGPATPATPAPSGPDAPPGPAPTEQLPAADGPPAGGPPNDPPGSPSGPPAGTPPGGPPGAPPGSPPFGAPPGGPPLGGPPGSPPIGAPVGPPLGAPGAPPNGGPPGGPPLPTAPPGGDGGGSRKGLFIALAAIVALVLIGAGVFFATRDDSNDAAADKSDQSDQTDESTAAKSKADKTDVTDQTDSSDASEATDATDQTDLTDGSGGTGQGDLKIVSQGASQFVDPVTQKASGSWAVVLGNDGKDAVQFIDVDVSFLDAGGAVLGTDSSLVSLLPAGLQTAVEGQMFDVPSGVTQLEVRVSPSDFPSDGKMAAGALTPDGVNTAAGSFGGIKVTGSLKSTFAVDVKDVTTVAVFFNTAGQVIGGASDLVNLVPANNSSGFEIDDLAGVPGVDHVQIFTQLPSDLLQ